MTGNNKPLTDNTGSQSQQAVQNDGKHINPFRDPAPADDEQSVEEETALEQQRKEALTERD